MVISVVLQSVQDQIKAKNADLLHLQQNSHDLMERVSGRPALQYLLVSPLANKSILNIYMNAQEYGYID